MIIIALIVAAGLLGIDQLTKWLAVTYIKPVHTIEIIKIAETQVLNFTYKENDGAAFSILQGRQTFLVVATVILLIALIIMLVTKKIKTKSYIWCVSLIIAGGTGNLIDRLVYGYVVDFIDFRIIRFAVFNVADMCVVIGAVLLCLFVILDDVKLYRQKKNQLVSAETDTAAHTQSDDDA